MPYQRLRWISNPIANDVCPPPYPSNTQGVPPAFHPPRAMQPSPTVSTETRTAGLASDPLAMGVAFALVLTVVQRGIGFIRGMLFCRLMPAEELGQWSVVWSSLMLLAPLAALGLPGSFCRYAEHYLQRGQLRPYISRIGTLASATTLLLAGVMTVLPQLFSMIIFREPNHESLVRVMAGVFVLVALFNAVQSLMESLRQVRVVTMMRFISGIVFAVAAVGLLLVWENGTLAVIIGFGISCFVGLIPAALFFVRTKEFIRDSNAPLSHASMWGKIVPFAAWIWVANFLNNSCDSIDRFLLLHLLPGDSSLAQSHLGQYHSSLIIPQLLVGVAVVISGTLLPYLSAAWERKEYPEARRLLRWTLKTTALGFLTVDLLILLAAPLLFNVALQGKYADGLAIMPLTMVYSFWFCMITCAQNALWCNERMRWVVLALGIGLIANIGLNSICIPLWGLHGTALATALANAICLATMLLILRREGWLVDRGTWLACGLPVIMTLGPIAAFAAWLLIVFGAWRSDWIFDAEEKQLLGEKADRLLARVRARMPGFSA